MQSSTIEQIDSIISENKMYLDRLIHSFDKGDYPGVVEDITEIGINKRN